MRFFALLILSFCFICGCAHKGFVAGSGEAGQFILQQVIAHGGHAIDTNNLPIISGKWSYSKDRDGAVLKLPRDQFSSVQSFLHQAFGEPSMFFTNTVDGTPLGVYGVKAVGAAIQFGYDQQTTFVIVLRPLSTDEIIEHIPAALKQLNQTN